jgi:hypothetical protein
MVLGAGMTNLPRGTFLALLAVVACGRPAADQPAAESASDTQLTAVREETNALGPVMQLLQGAPCTISFQDSSGSKELSLGLNAPCKFHRDIQGAVRVREVKGQPVILVERSVPDTAHAPDCITQVQAISRSDGGLGASKAVDRVAMCAPFQWDDVMFIGLVESGIQR